MSNEVNLKVFRRDLDSVDTEIVELLGKRFQICSKIAAYKSVNKIPMMQPGRIEEVKSRITTLAIEHNVDETFALRLYDSIIREACRLESLVIDQID